MTAKTVVERITIREERSEWVTVKVTLVLWSDGSATWENLVRGQSV